MKWTTWGCSISSYAVYCFFLQQRLSNDVINVEEQQHLNLWLRLSVCRSVGLPTPGQCNHLSGWRLLCKGSVFFLFLNLTLSSLQHQFYVVQYVIIGDLVRCIVLWEAKKYLYFCSEAKFWSIVLNSHGTAIIICSVRNSVKKLQNTISDKWVCKLMEFGDVIQFYNIVNYVHAEKSQNRTFLLRKLTSLLW